MTAPAMATAVRPWFEGRLVGFDTETTAPDPETARIVQASVVQLGGGEPIVKRTWLVNPGVEIPAEAAAIHGITTERARAEGMDARTAIVEISAELSSALAGGILVRPLVAFNACYDLTVLDREMRRHHQVGLNVNGPVIDPYVLDKRVDRYRKGSRKLGAMCEHYGARLEGAHDAACDAIAAARVAYVIAKRYPEIGAAELGELHRLQAGWFAEQAASLEAHFRKQGKNEFVSREWPMRAWGPAA